MGVLLRSFNFLQIKNKKRGKEKKRQDGKAWPV
jgi:hypothetical protein